MTDKQKAACVVSQSVWLLATILGMQAENQDRQNRGEMLAYTEDAFINIRNESNCGHNSAQMQHGKKYMEVNTMPTDPVREEMIPMLRNHDSLVVVLQDKLHVELGGENAKGVMVEIEQERQDFLTRLLRVIRGHMWQATDKEGEILELYADDELLQTILSLPEEK